jgi:plasmid stabilization system protein ParE
MNYAFHPEAETEFQEAIDYYEGCQTGLGFDFALEVHAAVKNICDYPMAWPVLDGTIRRCLTNRFPYGVVYSHEGDEVYILAVMHLHREPGYWKHRAPHEPL